MGNFHHHNLTRLILSELQGTQAQREWARAALAERGANLFERFCAALREETPSGRAAAAEALGPLGEDRAVNPLREALHDPHPWVRWSAATALGRLAGAAVPGLSETLRDSDPDARGLAAMALGQTGAAEAVAPLREALGDAAWRVRQAAVEALARLEARATVPELCRALEDPHVHVRRAAAHALGQVGEVPALEPLGRAAQSTDWDLRWAATEALKRLLSRLMENPQAAALAPLRRLNRPGLDPDLRRAVCQALRSLQAWLQETEGHVPARALSRTADPRAPIPHPASLSRVRLDEGRDEGTKG